MVYRIFQLSICRRAGLPINGLEYIHTHCMPVKTIRYIRCGNELTYHVISGTIRLFLGSAGSGGHCSLEVKEITGLNLHTYHGLLLIYYLLTDATLGEGYLVSAFGEDE